MWRIVRCLAAAGIASTTVALGAVPAAAGGGCHGALTDAAAVHVEISGLCFNPTVVRVRPGASVDWANRDGIEHTVTAVGTVFDADLQDGAGFSRRFAEVGTFPYYCRLHPGMVGVVVVADVSPNKPESLVANRSIPNPARRSHGAGWLAIATVTAVTAAATASLSTWYWRRMSRR